MAPVAPPMVGRATPYLYTFQYPIFTDGRTVGFVSILNYDFLMTLVLQRKPQFDSEFRIQIDHTDAVMAFGADTNMFPRIVLILWIGHVITENVVLHIFIVDREHELSAVGTVDAWLSFTFWI